MIRKVGGKIDARVIFWFRLLRRFIQKWNPETMSHFVFRPAHLKPDLPSSSRSSFWDDTWRTTKNEKRDREEEEAARDRKEKNLHMNNTLLLTTY